jgi:tetratricopeptide (TPR) repeat protein
MLGAFRILLHDLDTPERLETNPLLRRLFSGEITSHAVDKFSEGIELNLSRLSERERSILLRHDIGHVPANEVRRDLYISARQFTIERRRGLIRLFDYVMGSSPPGPDYALTPRRSHHVQARAIREKDILDTLRSKSGGRTNPVINMLERVSDDTAALVCDIAIPPSLTAFARARHIVRALVRRLPRRERQIIVGLIKRTAIRDIALALELSPRHTGRLRAKAVLELRRALSHLESRSQPSIEDCPPIGGPAPLALTLARALLQAGAYAGALHALEDALQAATDNTERLILNLEAADIELQAQLKPAASKRLQTARQLLAVNDISLVLVATGELRTSTLEAFLLPDYFVALEQCEQALRSFRSWLSQHRGTRQASEREVWALSCIAEVARTAGLPARARSAVVEAEQLVEQHSLQHSWVTSQLRLQRACADVALLGSLRDTLASLSDQFEESSNRGWFANATKVALSIVDFTSSIGRHADAICWAKWIASHIDRLSPLDRIVFALNFADALTRSGRPGDALRVLAPIMLASDDGTDSISSAAVEIRAAEALIEGGRPMEALAKALSALERFGKRKALPNVARAHAVAAQCYGALECCHKAMLHAEQSQFLAERFASPVQLLQVYTACQTVVDDRRIRASVQEMRRLIETSIATLPDLQPGAPTRLGNRSDPPT